MNFSLIVVLLLIVSSYIYMFRAEKSAFKITPEERKVYSKYIYSATVLVLIGLITSFFTESKWIDFAYLISLVLMLVADFYVWKRFTTNKQMTTNVSGKV